MFEETRREIVQCGKFNPEIEYWKASELISYRLDFIAGDSNYHKIETLCLMLGKLCDMVNLTTDQVLQLSEMNFMYEVRKDL